MRHFQDRVEGLLEFLGTCALILAAIVLIIGSEIEYRISSRKPSM